MGVPDPQGSEGCGVQQPAVLAVLLHHAGTEEVRPAQVCLGEPPGFGPVCCILPSELHPVHPGIQLLLVLTWSTRSAWVGPGWASCLLHSATYLTLIRGGSLGSSHAVDGWPAAVVSTAAPAHSMCMCVSMPWQQLVDVAADCTSEAGVQGASSKPCGSPAI
jgi:hypothetical protein